MTHHFTHLVVVASAVIGLASAACKGSEESKPSQPAPDPNAGEPQPEQPPAWNLATAAKPYQGVTLHTIGEPLPPFEAMAALTDEFESATGIKLTVEMVEHAEAESKVAADLEAETGHYDFIVRPHHELGRLVADKRVRSPTEYLNDRELRDPEFRPHTALFSRLWKAVSWYHSDVFGFPFTAPTMYVWYREDLLQDPEEQAGFKAKFGYELKAPTNWKEYKDLAGWFQRPKGTLYGTAIQGKQHQDLWSEWLNFLYSFGGDVLQADTGSRCGPVIINSPQAVESLEYYMTLLKHSPPDTLAYSRDDLVGLMQQGKVFQIIMWSDAIGAVEDAKNSTVAGKIGYVTLPQGKGGKVGQAGSWSYLIPTKSKNPKAAYLFMQWMMAHKQQLAQMLAGGSSARPDVYAEPSVEKLPYAKPTAETLEVVKNKLNLPEASQIAEIVARELHLALSRKKPAKRALDDAAVAINALLGGCAPLQYPVK